MIDSGKKVELLDPKIDYVFKRIFGEKGDEDILMSLLNSILKGNPTINELELLNTEYPKEGVITKGCQFDILAKTDNDTTINIEMQYRNNKNINDRIVYYSDRLNVNEYKVGEKYGEKKVISIWIFAENISDREEPISEIFPCYKENKNDKWEVVTENKRIIVFELNKYQTTNENFKDLLTNWVNFLQKPEYLENNPLKIKNKELDKTIEKLEYMSKNQQDKYIIDSFNDYERDYYNDTKTAKEEGLKEGKEEIAKNMLKKGYKIEDISELSGLSLDEIEELK